MALPTETALKAKALLGLSAPPGGSDAEIELVTVRCIFGDAKATGSPQTIAAIFAGLEVDDPRVIRTRRTMQRAMARDRRAENLAAKAAST